MQNVITENLEDMRKAYKAYQKLAFRRGFQGNFKLACARFLPVAPMDATAGYWVDAAETLAMSIDSAEMEEIARTEGFTCGLEMAMADQMVANAEKAQRLQEIN